MQNKTIISTTTSIILATAIFCSMANASQKVEIGDVTNPTIVGGNGNCPSGYVHNDLNGDGYEQNGECWQGMQIKDGRVAIGITNPQSLAGMRLFVAGDSHEYLYIYTSNANANAYLSAQTPNSNYSWYAAGYTNAMGLYDHKRQTNHLWIDGSTGNVGIGTTSPGNYRLNVNGQVYSSGGYSGSDIRWKTNIHPINHALENTIKLQGVNFEWKRNDYPYMNFSNGKQIGLIAQDVEKIIPELVVTDKDGYKAVAYEKIVVVLIEAIKEQQKQIDNLKHELKDIKSH